MSKYRTKILSRKVEVQFALVLTGILVYIIYWSLFSIDRFYSVHAYILDLGVAMESGWLIFHTPWTFTNFFHNFANLSGRILLSPIFIFGSFPLILVVQTVAISTGSIIIYLIGKELIGQKWVSLAASATYLIYFPLAGANFFDFHYQIFFIPFFLAGFYFYLRDRYIVSTILMAISGLFKFPFIAFPLIFSVLEIATLLFKGRTSVRTLRTEKFRFLVLGFAVFTLIGIFEYLSFMSGTSGPSGALLPYLNGSAYSLLNIESNLDAKIFTILLILGSLLFVPLRSRYMVLTLPFFFFALTFGYKSYYFPYVFQSQYSSALVPFLFIALIDALKNPTPPVERERAGLPEEGASKRIKSGNDRRALEVVLSIVIVVALLSQVYQPYGPLNPYSEDSFGAAYAMNASLREFNTFQHAIDLIPKNTPANEVFVQNDIPFVYPLPANFSSPLSFVQTLLYNSTGFFNNYTELGSDGKFYPISPKYVVMYPYGSYGPKSRFGYFEYVNKISPSPNNISNYEIVQHLLSTHNYGILAEADGLFILEKGYSGPLKYYVPFERYYSYSDFLTTSSSSITGKGIRFSTSSEGLLFYGPPTALSPGNYTVTYYFETSGNNASGFLHLESYYNGGRLWTSRSAIFNGSNQSGKSKTVSFTMSFSTSLFTADDQFNAYSYAMNGTIFFQGISIQQTAAPR